MIRLSPATLCCFFMLILCHCLLSQAPAVKWEGYYPGGYELGNYVVNDIKESPYGGYVVAGGRKMDWKGLGYNQVMVMRMDDEGGGIRMNEVFTGYTIDSLFLNNERVLDTIPWDQAVNDMIMTPLPHLSYLVTGYRDLTLHSQETPPGLFLMEILGDGRVKFDSIYFNNNQHHMEGRCIQPAHGGGYVVAGSIREDGGSVSKILVTHLAADGRGRYVPEGLPAYTVIPVGLDGYASWVRPFGEGYLLGGTAHKNPNSGYDLFLMRTDGAFNPDWSAFYGMEYNDEFSDALISGDTLYVAGTASVPVPGTGYTRYQIYVVKAGASGEIIWDRTYGGATRHFAGKIMMSAEGNLLVAGEAYDKSMHSRMVLLEIDAQSGDSLWMESYGEFYTAGIRDAIRTSDFGYILAGRASAYSGQDPRTYVMRLNNAPGKERLVLERKDLALAIGPGAVLSDEIQVAVEKAGIFSLCVEIDSLIHPCVGDLEITLEHEGTVVSLVDRPVTSGENFIRTAFLDAAERSLGSGHAPYTGWFRPDQALAAFISHDPRGPWSLNVTDHGTSAKKSTRVLNGWSLNFLVESAGGGTGVPSADVLEGFGLCPVRPNPVQGEAWLRFRIPEAGMVRLSVYNLRGQLAEVLVEEKLPEGLHERKWIPSPSSPGTCFLQLESGGRVRVRKVILLQ